MVCCIFTFKFCKIQFLNHFLNFYFLKVNISVTAPYLVLKFSPPVKTFSIRFFIWALVFILCQKTGNLMSFFKQKISTFHKIKTRTYIINEKSETHSLITSFKNKQYKFKVWVFYNSWDIQLQKIIVKIGIIDFMAYLHNPQFTYFQNKYICR